MSRDDLERLELLAGHQPGGGRAGGDGPEVEQDDDVGAQSGEVGDEAEHVDRGLHLVDRPVHAELLAQLRGDRRREVTAVCGGLEHPGRCDVPAAGSVPTRALRSPRTTPTRHAAPTPAGPGRTTSSTETPNAAARPEPLVVGSPASSCARRRSGRCARATAVGIGGGAVVGSAVGPAVGSVVGPPFRGPVGAPSERLRREHSPRGRSQPEQLVAKGVARREHVEVASGDDADDRRPPSPALAAGLLDPVEAQDGAVVHTATGAQPVEEGTTARGEHRVDRRGRSSRTTRAPGSGRTATG